NLREGKERHCSIRRRQYSRGSRKISSCVIVQATQATGIASTKSQTICTEIGVIAGSMQKAAPWFEIAGRVAWKWRPKQLCSKIRTKLNLMRSASQNACKNDTRLAGLSEILTPPSSE